jgi:hypothetical protein
VSRSADLVLAAALAAGLSACAADPYLERRDTVTAELGEAVAANRVAQTIDFWPDYVTDTRLPGSGPRARIAMERYRSQNVIEPVAAATGNGFPAPAAPAAPPPAPPATP